MATDDLTAEERDMLTGAEEAWLTGARPATIHNLTDTLREVARLRLEKQEQERQVRELLDVLTDMANQHCAGDDNRPDVLDSMALTANAWALQTLAEHGRAIITDCYGNPTDDTKVGRRCFAKLLPKPPPAKAGA
jgi:hypothetical protein